MIDRFNGPNVWLSNFFPCGVVYETITWTTVEHAYQAFKTLDVNARLHVLLNCETAGQAKKFGQRVILRPQWDKIKVPLMRELLRSKFHTGGILGEELVRTYPHELIEGNTWHDNFWGDCVCPECKVITGKNWLGKLLMERRQELLILGQQTGITEIVPDR